MRKKLRKRTHRITVAKVLHDLLEATEYYTDDGPEGEGWQSRELSTARYRAKRLVQLLEKRK